MKMTVPNPNLDQQHLAPATEAKIEFSFGLIAGVPLSWETLALIAMKRIYYNREQIVRAVAFKCSPEFINEAQEITQALRIMEKLLHGSGIRTELNAVDQDNPQARYTFLEIADDVLQHSGEIPATTERAELLAVVNKQFRPWINQPKAAAAR